MPPDARVVPEPVNRAEDRINKDTSLAKTWAEWSKERDGTQAWPPPAKEIPTPGLAARVELERASTGLHQPIAAVLVLSNDTQADVAVVRVVYRIEPRTGSVPPAVVWVAGPGVPKPPVVPARGEIALAFTIGAFTCPQVRPAVTYWIEATVQFADGTQLDSIPAAIAVHPPM